MPNRLTRDELLSRALDQADCKALDLKDRPGGVIQPNAMCITWLQDGIDLFHRVFPWTGLMAQSALSITSSTNAYALPSDYTLVFKDGVRINQTSPLLIKRLHQRDWNWFLSRDTTVNTIGEPDSYVIRGTSVYLWPWPQTTYTGELHYYKLPAVLAANAVPNFPDDWVLVQYVKLCGKEWFNEEPRGVAIEYANAVIAKLRQAGLGQESENNALPLDSAFFRPSGSGGGAGYDSWLGDTVPRT